MSMVDPNLLTQIEELGLSVYAADGCQLFLDTPSQSADGLTPRQMIELGRAADVLAILASDYEGLGF
jgi:hypothetical protein